MPTDTIDGTVDAYAAAGVDIAAGDDVVERYRSHVARTMRPEVLGGLGGFAAATLVDVARWREPVLITGTDGVGTKLQVAARLGRWRGVGIDLVAMCVNDIITSGAEPLLFLDYLATGRLDPVVAEQVVAGVADGCELAGCALVGGETAEMPGTYRDGDIDLAGFAVGIAERSQLLGAHRVQAGDELVGIAASGLHSNGFSLARAVLMDGDDALDLELDPHGMLGRSLGTELLEPTRIYARAICGLLESDLPLHAAAHVTGGGLPGNLPRMLPDTLDFTLDRSAWAVPPIFDLIARHGQVDERTMQRTFNLGLGMVLAVSNGCGEATCTRLAELGERATVVGAVVARRSV